MKYDFPSIPFFTILRILFLLVKLTFMATLTGDIHRLCSTSLGLPQYSTSARDGRIRPRACFQFNVQKCPVAESSGSSLPKNPCSDTRIESYDSGRKSLSGGAFASFTDS